MDCLAVVRKHKDKILNNVNTYLNYVGMNPAIQIWLFNSRVVGTCRENSDIDVYVQVHEKHLNYIKKKGQTWAGELQLSCGRDMKMMGLTLVDKCVWDGIPDWPIELDVCFGIEDHPPVNLDKYGDFIAKGGRHSMKFEEL